MGAKTISRYIVADPEICHGEPIFRAHVYWLRTCLNRWLVAWHGRLSLMSGVGH